MQSMDCSKTVSSEVSKNDRLYDSVNVNLTELRYHGLYLRIKKQPTQSVLVDYGQVLLMTD